MYKVCCLILVLILSMSNVHADENDYIVSDFSKKGITSYFDCVKYKDNKDGLTRSLSDVLNYVIDEYSNKYNFIIFIDINDRPDVDFCSSDNSNFSEFNFRIQFIDKKTFSVSYNSDKFYTDNSLTYSFSQVMDSYNFSYLNKNFVSDFASFQSELDTITSEIDKGNYTYKSYSNLSSDSLRDSSFDFVYYTNINLLLNVTNRNIIVNSLNGSKSFGSNVLLNDISYLSFVDFSDGENDDISSVDLSQTNYLLSGILYILLAFFVYLALKFAFKFCDWLF